MAPPVPTPSTPSAATTPSSAAPGTTGSTAGPASTASTAKPATTPSTAAPAPTRWKAAPATTPTTPTDLGDIVREAAAGAAGGTDTVYASVGFTLGANLEHLTLYGSALRGEGNQLANRITGNAGANELFGRLGRDTLIGNAGDDLLDGGADIDRMEGGAGNDAYYVDNAGDVTIETLVGAAGGTDTVYASVNRTLGANLEHLRLYGSATTGTGNALANAITGNGGNNVLSGLNGNDTLIGGLGNDPLRGGAGNDTLSGGSPDSVTDFDWEAEIADDGKDAIDGGSGTDTLVFGETGYWDSPWTIHWLDPDMYIDLSAGTVTYLSYAFKQDTINSIENVTASSGSDTIVGTSGANVIRAGGGSNVVQGGGGGDTIHGGGKGVWYGGGTETLSGGAGNDVIYSNNSLLDNGRDSPTWAEDYVSGGAGDDRLISGYGLIRMNGGRGADRFQVSTNVWEDYRAWGYSYDARGTYTKVEDFSRSEGDKLAISVISHDPIYGIFDGRSNICGDDQ